MSVEDIDNNAATLRNLGGSCGKTGSSESTPAPAAAKSIVERLKGLLILGSCGGSSQSVKMKEVVWERIVVISFLVGEAG